MTPRELAKLRGRLRAYVTRVVEMERELGVLAGGRGATAGGPVGTADRCFFCACSIDHGIGRVGCRRLRLASDTSLDSADQGLGMETAAPGREGDLEGRAGAVGRGVVVRATAKLMASDQQAWGTDRQLSELSGKPSPSSSGGPAGGPTSRGPGPRAPGRVHGVGRDVVTTPRRGEVWWIRQPRRSEQADEVSKPRRPYLVVSTAALNQLEPDLAAL